MAQDQQVTAYDLAREIAIRLKQETQVVETICDGDEEIFAEVSEYEATLVIEPLIAAALRNGGVRP